MHRTQEQWIREYERRDALWIHDGNPKRPHALLTSGKHSSGFFNSELVMEDPCLLDKACSDLVSLLGEAGWRVFSDGVDRVVGPAMGAITMAHDLARHLQIRRAYVEKIDGTKKMRFGRTKIRSNERILLCEDVLTTGESVEHAAEAVLEAGGRVLPYVLVLVNRSGETEINKKLIVSLISHPMPVWEPAECPLCNQGSEAVRPKASTDNWERLTAAY